MLNVNGVIIQQLIFFGAFLFVYCKTLLSQTWYSDEDSYRMIRVRFLGDVLLASVYMKFVVCVEVLSKPFV